MPAHERVAFAKLVEQPRRLQHDVWSNKLFHAIDYTRMRAQLPRPTKIEVWPIETSDTAAQRGARLFNFAAKVAHLVRGQNRDRIEEPQFIVVRQLFEAKS